MSDNENVSPKKIYMKTFSNVKFNPLDPNPSDIKIEDIAHALSYICRGNGQVKSFYSVGQHCINAAKEASVRDLSERVILACLLHDASEAYMSDFIRPIKELMPTYREAENRLLDVIYERFGLGALSVEEKRLVKEIDDALLEYDMAELLYEPIPENGYKFRRTPDIKFRPFEEVEKEYLEIYKKYTCMI